MSDLIDTTEMYLRTIFELEEEGITPLRARIAERLGQSGPTVSQTVARMERDGLLAVEGDRHLELSDDGRAMATRVMRKHRLAAHRRQLEVAVARDDQQSVALHPGDGLGDRRAGVPQPLGDPGSERNDAFLFELEDRP